MANYEFFFWTCITHLWVQKWKWWHYARKLSHLIDLFYLSKKKKKIERNMLKSAVIESKTSIFSANGTVPPLEAIKCFLSPIPPIEKNWKDKSNVSKHIQKKKKIKSKLKIIFNWKKFSKNNLKFSEVKWNWEKGKNEE